MNLDFIIKQNKDHKCTCRMVKWIWILLLDDYFSLSIRNVHMFSWFIHIEQHRKASYGHSSQEKYNRNETVSQSEDIRRIVPLFGSKWINDFSPSVVIKWDIIVEGKQKPVNKKERCAIHPSRTTILRKQENSYQVKKSKFKFGHIVGSTTGLRSLM